MATIVGALFDAESDLSAADKFKAVTQIGSTVEFENAFGPGSPLSGTGQNDVFYVDNTSTTVSGPKGGIDIVVASADYTLGNGIEHLLMAGDDGLSAWGNNGANVIAGNDGNNFIDGGNGDDALVGGAGRDTLIGGNGHDFICGGDDSDSIDSGNGHDSIIGGTGRDTITGGNGNDTIDSGADSDSVDGGNGHDSIIGGGGRDTITGGNGNDTIDGGVDSDSLIGGAGHDLILGGSGQDVIFGGDGSDTIKGGENDDTITGGKGADYFFFDNSSSKDVILDFKAGVDYVVFVSDPGSSIQPGSDILGDFAHTVGDDVVIKQSSGNSITLKDVDIGDLDSSDFIII